MPLHRGFGTRLIERSLIADENDTHLEYGADGLTCNLALVLE